MGKKIPANKYVMLIGGMKCGTGFLFNYLKNHPQICPCDAKEPEYFSEHQSHGIQQDLRYCDLFSFDKHVHKYAFEASTGYTKYPLESNVAQNIYDYGLQPKFIYVVRNPFQRIVSNYNFFMKMQTYPRKVNNYMNWIDVSKYYLQLQQYRKYFPKRDILVLEFDELINNPQHTLKVVYQFLNLSFDYWPEEFSVVNRTKVESHAVEKMVNTYGKKVRIIPQPLRELAKKLIRKQFPTKKQTLTKSEKKYIYEELKADMLNLQKEYQVDVKKWGF